MIKVGDIISDEETGVERLATSCDVFIHNICMTTRTPKKINDDDNTQKTSPFDRFIF